MTFEECIAELKEAIEKSLVILQDAFRKIKEAEIDSEEGGEE